MLQNLFLDQDIEWFLLKQMQKIKIKSAFIELIENKNYSKSEQLFLEASMDYKQVDLEIVSDDRLGLTGYIS